MDLEERWSYLDLLNQRIKEENQAANDLNEKLLRNM